MKTTSLILAALIVAIAAPCFAQYRDVVDYDIEVALDPKTHELTGRQTVRWRNTGGVPTAEIWLHLYLNAFAGSETTFMRGVRRSGFGGSSGRADGWGWTRVTGLSLADGTDLLPGWTFERPDDGNEADFTVARVVLPSEVMPGASITLEMTFEARLPRVVARTGYDGDFHMVAQWFPKVAVFEGEAGWNCHQFHATTEFFADFGSYRVRMTIPRGWVVGATGEQIAREPVATDDVVEFRAAQVHDFAWATAPPALMKVVEADFEPGRDVPPEWLDQARETLDLAAADLELPPMSIRLLVPTSQERLAPRMVRAARLSIAWFGLYFGPYPQPQLTIVSPPPGADEAGGMEYPTLITTGASRLAAYPPFKWRRGIESVTVHEFGHQYFHSLVATNEFEQAWLDEGLTTWAQNKCLADIVDSRLVPEMRFAGLWDRDRNSLAFMRPPVVIDRLTWKYRGLSDHFLASYFKTSVAMRTLEGLVGEERMARAMRAYVGAHRYRHPTGDDLRSSLEETLGEDLGWFFDAVIEGSAEPDWAVLRVRQRQGETAAGMVWRDGDWREVEAATDGGDATDPDHGPWRVEIEIGRLGDLIGPVDVELLWADGRRERRRWDSRDRWVRWSEESTSRLEQVVVDPDVVWALETRRADNYWRDRPSVLGPLWWLDDAVRLIGLMTVPWA